MWVRILDFLKADCLGVETVPNLVFGVLMLRLVSFAKSYKQKQLVADVIWGLNVPRAFIIPVELWYGLNSLVQIFSQTKGLKVYIDY